MKAEQFNKLPLANRNLVAHEKPLKGKGGKMLYSITKEGRLKIHRDLSKWRSKIIGKKHTVYFSEAPSVAEQEAGAKIRAVIARCTKELNEAQESAVITKAMRKQALRDALLNV